jgi:hypothetical protein
VEGRRRGDENDIGANFGEGGGVVGVGGRNAVAFAKGFEAGGFEVDRRDELDASLGGFDGANVGIADAAGADEEGAVDWGGGGGHAGEGKGGRRARRYGEKERGGRREGEKERGGEGETRRSGEGKERVD